MSIAKKALSLQKNYYKPIKKSKIMNRKIIFSVLFLALYVSAGFAQMRVFPDGRVGFGRYLANDRGIYISETPNLTNPVPFDIMRTRDDDIILTRSLLMQSEGIIDGIMLSRSGRTVLLGAHLDFFMDAWRTRNDFRNAYTLAVSAPWQSHGIGVNLHEAHYVDGVRVILCSSFGGARPFAAYNRTSLRDRAIFYVNEHGVVYSRGYALISDRSEKENIEPIENALDRLMQLQGLSFNFIDHFADERSGRTMPSQDEIFESARQRTPELTKETFLQIKEEQSRRRLGVIAQDVEKVFPELVRTQEDGLKTVFYSELTAVLIEAIREQQAQIETLNARIEQLERGIIGIPAPPPVQTMSAPAPASSDDWTSFDETTVRVAALYQNVPNPFRQGTEIRFYLPQTVAAAFLIFYDLQGRQLHQITLTQRGEGVEFISGSQFAPGIYLYALIADGQAVAVKQMIITE